MYNLPTLFNPSNAENSLPGATEMIADDYYPSMPGTSRDNPLLPTSIINSLAVNGDSDELLDISNPQENSETTVLLGEDQHLPNSLGQYQNGLGMKSNIRYYLLIPTISISPIFKQISNVSIWC